MHLYSDLPLLAWGASGEHVDLARRALRSWLTKKSPSDTPLNKSGDFNRSMVCHTKAFQCLHEGAPDPPKGERKFLKVDGKIGENTWYALAAYTPDIRRSLEDGSPALLSVDGEYNEDFSVTKEMPHNLDGVSDLAIEVLKTAISQLGKKEEGGNNHGREIEKYQGGPSGSNSKAGAPWCASFVSWCVWQASGAPSAMPFSYTASSRAIERSLRKSGQYHVIETLDDIYAMRPGDILCWYRCGRLRSHNGHIGFVHHVDGNTVYTIEGNKRPRVSGEKYVMYETDAESLLKGFLGFGRV